MNTTLSKIQMGNRLQIFLSLALLLPFFFIYSSYNEWNPFMLGGPHFLNFYMLLLLIAYLIMFLLQAINNSIQKNNESGYNVGVQEENITANNQYYPFSKLLALLVLILGSARLFQGVNNSKPVGFLLLLLIFHILFFIGIKGFLKKNGSRKK